MPEVWMRLTHIKKQHNCKQDQAFPLHWDWSSKCHCLLKWTVTKGTFLLLLGLLLATPFSDCKRRYFLLEQLLFSMSAEQAMHWNCCKSSIFFFAAFQPELFQHLWLGFQGFVWNNRCDRILRIKVPATGMEIHTRWQFKSTVRLPSFPIPWLFLQTSNGFRGFVLDLQQINDHPGLKKLNTVQYSFCGFDVATLLFLNAEHLLKVLSFWSICHLVSIIFGLSWKSWSIWEASHLQTAYRLIREKYCSLEGEDW